jgi:amidohydrolase family protein
MTPTDSGIERRVGEIRAIDDHAHLPIFPTLPADMDRPFDPYGRGELARAQRFLTTDPPIYLSAWRALWDYEYDDWSDDHLRDLIVKREKIQADAGDGYDAWILDKLNFESVLYIAPAPLPKAAPAYRWVFHLDALLWPCQTAPANEQWLIAVYGGRMQGMCAEAGYAESVPPTLARFLEDIVDSALDRAKTGGAVAIKSNAPYYRSLSFADVAREDAERLYERGAREGHLDTHDHRALQDFLFRYIVGRAGELNLPIQIHTGLGHKHHFQTIDSDPLLLDPLLADFPATKFLLLHTGWPFDSHARSSLAHANVWMDISATNLEFSARTLSEMIRKALELFPERLLFGTDAHTDEDQAFLCSVPAKPNPLAGWEEKAWVADQTSREALTIALSQLLQDGDVTATRVDELAAMVMRANAVALYEL